MNMLEQLVGQKVLNYEVGKGTIVLNLSEAILATYNPAIGATLAECIGAIILSVQIIEKESFSLTFSNGSVLRISLKDEDYSGPEAFSVRFSDGTIVVDQ